jgi:hypothetical protein
VKHALARAEYRIFAWGVRIAGLVGLLWLVAQPPDLARTPAAAAIAATGLAIGWLALTGGFGTGRLREEDQVILPITVLALAVRLVLVRAGNSEIRVYLPHDAFSGPWAADKHSLVYAGWEAVFFAVVGPANGAFMRLNGVAGALATVPLYLFVRRRLDDPLAAALAGLAFAVHPLEARLATTDAHGSFLLLFLFGGLALLADARGPRELGGGLACLGVAGALRIEALAYSGLALLLVDWRAIASEPEGRGSRALGLAGGGLVAAALILANFLLQRQSWSSEVHAYTSAWWHPDTLDLPLQKPVLGPFSDVRYSGDGLLRALTWVGLVGGLVRARSRVLVAVTSAVIAVLCLYVLRPAAASHVNEHRYVVLWALQAVLVGVGAAAPTATAPTRWRPALAAAAVAVLVTVPLVHLDELAAEYAYNTEYDLVHDHVRPDARSGRCALLYFNDGDIGLNNPEGIAPGIDATVCLDSSCGDAVRPGQCAFLLWGQGCSSLGNAPERHGGRPLKDLCVDVLARFDAVKLEEHATDFVLAYGTPQPPEKFPATGTLAIYAISPRPGPAAPGTP